LSKKESVGLKRTDRKLGRRLQIISTQRPAGGQQQPDVSGGHDKETFARWVRVLLLSQFRSGRANLLSGSPKQRGKTRYSFSTLSARIMLRGMAMIYDAFISALTDAGVREPANRVVISRIPVRT
jgi:hypothetical protein